jgi:hypothetical protein
VPLATALFKTFETLSETQLRVVVPIEEEEEENYGTVCITAS